MPEDIDRTTEIPSQGWYNLVVYDADPSTISSVITVTGEQDKEAALKAIEDGLSFINDRRADGSHSGNPDYPNDEPSSDRLQEVEDTLKRQREQIKNEE